MQKIFAKLKVFLFQKAKQIKYFFSPKVAVHGIQRSGTNYLCQYLFKSGIGVINFPDPERNDPRHKHFRWYANKAHVPSVIRHQYMNRITANSLDNLNRICRYHPKTFHFVVVKDKHKWIVSILNWGLRCGWFNSVDEAVANVYNFAKDYDSYYEFWKSLQERNPERILLVSIPSIKADIKSFNYFLFKICNLRSVPCFDGIFYEVAQSPIDRVNYFTDNDLLKIKSNLK